MVDVVSRAGWGSRYPRGGATITTPVARLWLHHSASDDQGFASVRSFQRFHIETRGWADIGYSWLYSPRYRTFYEGRGPGRSGAHTAGDNSNSHGLCVIGNYDRDTLPPHAVDDLKAFLGWHHRQGYGPSMFAGGHRDAPGASTSCPGSNLHRLIGTINAGPRPQEDIVASLDDLRRVMREESHVDPLVRDRINETVRLSMAACAAGVAAIRADVGLPADPESDLVHVKRIREGKPKGYDLVEVRRRLEEAARR